MKQSPNIIEIIQIKKELRKLLPMLPEDEKGETGMNFHTLEGFLYGMVISPIPYPVEEWGAILDEYLSVEAYNDPHLQHNVLTLYDYIQEHLQNNNPHMIHSVSFKEADRNPDPFLDGYSSWIRGLFLSQSVSLELLPDYFDNAKKRKQAKKILRGFYDELTLFMEILIFLRNPEIISQGNEKLLQLYTEQLEKPENEVFEEVLTLGYILTEEVEYKLDNLGEKKKTR